MSLNDAIGKSWFFAYKSDVYPHDFCVIKGKKVSTPRFYDVLYEREDGEEALERIKRTRKRNALKFHMDQTPERLAVREKCAQATLGKLRRDLT